MYCFAFYFFLLFFNLSSICFSCFQHPLFLVSFFFSLYALNVPWIFLLSPSFFFHLEVSIRCTHTSLTYPFPMPCFVLFVICQFFPQVVFFMELYCMMKKELKAWCFIFVCLVNFSLLPFCWNSTQIQREVPGEQAVKVIRISRVLLDSSAFILIITTVVSRNKKTLMASGQKQYFLSATVYFSLG